MKKTILITGGIGYIGSHCVVAFEKAGYKTVIVDNLDNSCLSTYRQIGLILGYKPDFYELDLRDSSKLEGVFKKYKFDGVIHFAGLKAVGESCEKPFLYFDNNIVGSLRLFELMEKYGVRNIIFSSTGTVYDKNVFEKYDFSGAKETDLTGNTTNPYSTSKFILENFLKDLSVYKGFRVVNLRYFNPIGAHESGKIGEDPEGIPNNLLPFVMKVASGEYEKLRIFGGDYDTIDGTGVRDYIDVVDLIDGHLKAYEFMENTLSIPSIFREGASREQPSEQISEQPSEQPSPQHSEQPSPQPSPLEEREQRQGLDDETVQKGFFEVFNLGVGRGVSVLEFVGIARKVTGKEIPYEIIDRRSGDLAVTYCNPKKANEILGWKASTSLEKSLENSWNFYSKNTTH